MQTMGGVRGNAGDENNYVGVRTKILYRGIYFAKPRSNIGYQFGSHYRRGLGRWAPQIMREYELANEIAVWLLTYPHMYGRSPSF